MKRFIFALLLSGLSLEAYGLDNPLQVNAESGPVTQHHEHATDHWSAPPKAAKRRNPAAPSKASIRRGRSLYQHHCANCHGVNGTGEGSTERNLIPAPPDLNEMARHHSDGDLAWKIANGRGAMPGWQGTLTQRQIWDVVNYLKHADE